LFSFFIHKIMYYVFQYSQKDKNEKTRIILPNLYSFLVIICQVFFRFSLFLLLLFFKFSFQYLPQSGEIVLPAIYVLQK